MKARAFFNKIVITKAKSFSKLNLNIFKSLLRAKVVLIWAENIIDGYILIVDDSKLNILLLEKFILDAGYNVRYAINGEEALQSVRAEIPLLILLDISMPGMDGYKLCKKLKSLERTRNIPIIFVSAMIDQASKDKGILLGGDDYITKPYNFEDILLKIKVYVH